MRWAPRSRRCSTRPRRLADALDEEGYLERDEFGYVTDCYDMGRLLEDAEALAQTPQASPAFRFAVRVVRRDPRFGAGLCPDAALHLIDEAIGDAHQDEVEAALGNARRYLARHLPPCAPAQCQAVF